MTNKIEIVNESDGEKYKHFLPLLLEHKDRVYGYILTLVPRPNVADDIMQDTVLVMWEKFSDFKVGTNFYGWAKCIALNKVREYRRNTSKSPLIFDEEVIDRLNTETESNTENNQALERLETCLKALSKVEAKLIELRFVDKATIKKIAEYWGKAPGSVYRQMSKIIFKLRECISRKPVGLE